MSKGSGNTRSGGGTANAVSSSASTKSLAGIDKDTQEYIRMVQGNWGKDEADKFYELEGKVYDKYMEKASLNPTTLKTQAEKDAVADYKQWGFEDLNANLRQGKALSSDQEKMKKGLDSAIQRTTLSKDTIVYRGTPREHSGSDKGYTSTSANPYQANRFTYGGTGLHAYLIPKGTHALVIGGGEEEIILPRGFNLKKHRIM